MRIEIDVLLDYDFPAPAEVLLAVEVAQLPDQVLLDDLLTVDGAGPLAPIAGEEGIGQRTWLRAEGHLRATYRATVEIERPAVDLESLAAVAKPQLPPLVVPYLWPSRYCEADRFEAFVDSEFGALEGGAKIIAMANWIQGEMAYVPGSSSGQTTAADAFVARQGVCRDYAHLMATFARAAGIPARLVSAYALKLDPPDFHALVEVWLDGGWHLIDATAMVPTANVARIAVGRDATDIAFMTIFGAAEMIEQRVGVTLA
ncbi:MAG: transglutaminase family protein [Bradyrhizobium sp.]|uniref:transglutaminase-like domain-containing protein n=1 Tax=Bradyrhizobium sp. TaxID=376 RepID=UPI003D0FAB92